MLEARNIDHSGFFKHPNGKLIDSEFPVCRKAERRWMQYVNQLIKMELSPHVFEVQVEVPAVNLTLITRAIRKTWLPGIKSPGEQSLLCLDGIATGCLAIEQIILGKEYNIFFDPEKGYSNHPEENPDTVLTRPLQVTDKKFYLALEKLGFGISREQHAANIEAYRQLLASMNTWQIYNMLKFGYETNVFSF